MRARDRHDGSRRVLTLRRSGRSAPRTPSTARGRAASRRRRSRSASPFTACVTRSRTSSGSRTSMRSCGGRSRVTSPRKCSAITQRSVSMKNARQFGACSSSSRRPQPPNLLPPLEVGFGWGFGGRLEDRELSDERWPLQAPGILLESSSGIPDANRRPSAWEADTLPLS